METSFWGKYKVFIFGLIGAIALAIQQAFAEPPANQDVKVYLYAGLMAALSFVATQWRGKNVSITGILGTLAGVFVTMQTAGNFTWSQFVTSAVLAVLAVVAPPPKPASYEHDEFVIRAKEITPIAPQSELPAVPIGTIDPNKPIIK